MRPLIAIALLLLLGAGAVAPSAEAKKSRRARAEASPDLWATVNVCDTPARDNTIGIRASMPGVGLRSTLSMRFTVQYYDDAVREWRALEEGGDSKWVRIGQSRKRRLESGFSFEFEPPAGGSTLRGLVLFRWRSRGHKTMKLREVTEAGHQSTLGADPPNFSAATCQLR